MWCLQTRKTPSRHCKASKDAPLGAKRGAWRDPGRPLYSCWAKNHSSEEESEEVPWRASRIYPESGNKYEPRCGSLPFHTGWREQPGQQGQEQPHPHCHTLRGLILGFGWRNMDGVGGRELPREGKGPGGYACQEFSSGSLWRIRGKETSLVHRTRRGRMKGGHIPTTNKQPVTQDRTHTDLA